ncbi:hypothetical protein LTS18_014480, partial [Coniosporium uncinatum]
MGKKKNRKERAKSQARWLSKDAPLSPSVMARLSPSHDPFGVEAAEASNPNLIGLGRPNRLQQQFDRGNEEKEKGFDVVRAAEMGPTIPANEIGAPGPHPSYIEIAKPYVFEQKLQEHMTKIGMSEAKESEVRLRGITWIDSTRRALQLPVRTYNTAAVYYHKFRLVHPDNEYNYQDAAAAALFAGCKIEDTLKKSKEILCAATNAKLSPAEQLQPDDPLFDAHSKVIIGLERLMLEASGFDFRNRHPQKLVIKLAKACGLRKESGGKTAWDASLDLYRTFAPLKQTTQTMAIA